MALAEQALRVRFAGGIDTDSDPKAVPAVNLAALENGVFDRASAIKKRNGYDALSQAIDGSAALASDAIRTAARGDELLAFSRNRCYSRQTGEDQWSDAGSVFSALGSDRPLVRTGTQQAQPDHATLDGVTAVAWEDSNGGVWWSTVDATTGRVYRAPTQADANGISPRCVAVGANLHVYYALQAAGRIMVLVVNPATPSSAVTPAILVDDLSTTDPHYDACSTSRGDTPAAIAWFENGTTSIRLGYVDDSGALGSPLNGHPSILIYAAVRAAGTPLAIASHNVDGDNADRLGLAYVTGTTGTIAFFSGGEAGVAAIALVNTGGAYASTDVRRCTLAVVASTGAITGLAAWEEHSDTASNRRVVVTSYEVVGNTSAAVGTVRSVGLASRAFAIDSDVFALFVHDTTYFNTYVTLRYSTSEFTEAGRHAPASAAGAPARKHLSSAHVSTDDVVTIALPFRERLVSENDDKFRETGIRLFTLDFDSEDSHQTARLGAGLYMAGACPTHYDGRVWAEQGFHFGPEVIGATPAGGGSMTASTTYEYRAWYENTDAQGEVHPGPTSIGTVVTMAGGQTQVTLTLPTLRVTRKSNVRIRVARTRAASQNKPDEFFAVTSLDPTTAGAAANGYVANSTTVDSVTFVDRMSDTDLEQQEPLYTNGGILSNDPAPLGSIVAGFKGRLLFTDPSDGNLLHATQIINPGYGVEAPPEILIAVDPFGGDITALATRDDRAFVFKASAIFTFVGDGPDATGSTTSGGFATPQLLPGDVGCTDPASIVLTPLGHMFKSAKGIYRVGNDGSLEYVGAPVSTYNSQRVRRATVLPNRTQVVFLTDSGVSLLYDYRRDQWSTFTNHEGLDSVVVSNTYHYLRTDGRMFRETVGEHSDAGARIKLRFETAPLHLQEHLQGFMKFFEVHLLGTWRSPHQLGVQFRTDYSDTWYDLYWLDATGLDDSAGWITGDTASTIGEDPITGTAYGDGLYGDGVYGGVSPGLYQWRHDLYEKGSSIQFAFEDFEADGFAGAAFELTELLLTGGIKRNAPKPYSGARAA